MQHRSVHDVMTPKPVTVRPTATFKEVVRTLHEADVTAVPVVDDGGRPVGVVSEADLLRVVAERPDLEGRLWGARLIASEHGLPEAETAADLMTAPPVTARPSWNLVETAKTMHEGRVKRLPVVDDSGRLVGIVSRADLLRPFLRNDHAIREEVERDVLDTALGIMPGTVRVTVRDGVVSLAGQVHDGTDLTLVDRLCHSVDGVVAVHRDLGLVPAPS